MYEDKPFKKPKRSGRNFIGYIVAGVTAAAVSVGIYAGGQYLYQVFTNKEQTFLDNPAAAQIDPSNLKELKKTSESFRAVAKMVTPSVVKIEAVREAPPRRSRRQMPGRGGQENPFNDPFWEFFFGRPPGGGGGGQPFGQGQRPQESLGSGVVIDSKGHIVTNNHVVKDATKIIVHVSRGNDTTPDIELKAKIIGTDPRTDLAVIKVDSPKPLPFVEWADSSKVAVGDWAIAIGSPFALTHTVTVGIVSAKGRNSSVVGSTYSELIQTDAAINPGNSGGPLVTIEGQVMGINQAIYTRSGGYMGIGFAIPANVAKDVTAKLITDGRVVRGWLGVYIEPAKASLLEDLKLDFGISVQRVLEGSPAEKSGLKAGDVIIEVDGTKITDVGQLQRFIGQLKPNQRVKIKVVSYATGKRRTVNVKIGELKEDAEDKPRPVVDENTEPDEIGLVLSKSSKGLEVDYVKPGSLAQQAQIEVGDILLTANRKKLRSLKDYERALKAAKKRRSRDLNLLVKRQKQSMFVQITLP